MQLDHYMKVRIIHHGSGTVVAHYHHFILWCGFELIEVKNLSQSPPKSFLVSGVHQSQHMS